MSAEVFILVFGIGGFVAIQLVLAWYQISMSRLDRRARHNAGEGGAT